VCVEIIKLEVKKIENIKDSQKINSPKRDIGNN